jgi:hypothetical protein
MITVPLLIAIFGTLILGLLFKGIDTYLSATANQRLALGENKRVETVNAMIPDCPMYFQRQFDLKMLDAGIITDADVSTCDNLGCTPCRTSKKTVQWVENYWTGEVS